MALYGLVGIEVWREGEDRETRDRDNKKRDRQLYQGGTETRNGPGNF